MQIKICGITRLEDALLAVELGAHALGFIFHPKSPRFIFPEDAAEITKQLPAEVKRIGVFVSPTLVHVQHLLASSKMDIAQVHGEHLPELKQLGGRRLIYAVPVHQQFAPESIGNYRNAVAVLLDTYKAGQHGGTGETFNWQLATAAKKYGRIILAGGLNPDNICAAIQEVNPWMLDVNSGVEESPGKKSHHKLRKLFDNIKECMDGTSH
ncbi:MAG: phosphoribosylanthranilate isomerase [Calditrichia bacterium]